MSSVCVVFELISSVGRELDPPKWIWALTLICHTLHKKLLAAVLVEELGALNDDRINSSICTSKQCSRCSCNYKALHNDCLPEKSQEGEEYRESLEAWNVGQELLNGVDSVVFDSG